MHVQHTIASEINLSGVGLHTGQPCSVILQPGEINTGIIFTDGTVSIKADVSKVIGTQRSTDLGLNDFSVMTIEHLMAALHALHIENIVIHTSGPEIPILDGSSKPFMDALQHAGIVDQEIAADVYIVEEVLHFTDPESGAQYTVMPSDKLEITVMVDFESEYIGKQFAQLSDLQAFDQEIARCRTFAMVSDIYELKNHDLIKGGSFDNAIVFADNRSVTDIELEGKTLSVSNEGILNPEPLRFTNEPARHKLLDLVGDLGLLGRPIQAKIIAMKPGHQGNVALVKELKKDFLAQRKLRGKPKYDPNVEPIMDINALTDLLPHRYPFLLVDKIIRLDDEIVVGVKNVTMNEGFFQGHFPNNPIFPGVLQMEALAQAGGILVLHTVDNPKDYDTYFMKMEKVKFKAKVIPGDTLILKMQLLSPVRRGIVHMQGTAYVGNKIVSEGELTAQIIKVRGDDVK